MEGPAGLRVQPFGSARLFSVEEANTLLPRLTEIFRRMDPKLARLREIRDMIEDAESYWGSHGDGMPTEDRAAYERHKSEADDLQKALDADMRDVSALGCELKDVGQGLVDFPASIEGTLAYLCWQFGEPGVGYWHTLEGGFAGRHPLKPSA